MIIVIPGDDATSTTVLIESSDVGGPPLPGLIEHAGPDDFQEFIDSLVAIQPSPGLGLTEREPEEREASAAICNVRWGGIRGPPARTQSLLGKREASGGSVAGAETGEGLRPRSQEGRRANPRKPDARSEVQMSLDSVKRACETAEAARALGFYVTKSDNRDPELHCRVWPFPGLDKAAMEAFAVELNIAVKPVAEALAKHQVESAARSLQRECDDAKP